MVYAMTVAQLARLWGVSGRAVYRLVETGELGHLRIGHAIRIRQSDRESYESRAWRAPDTINPPTASSSAEPAGMSGGGNLARGTAFRRGQISAVPPRSTSRNS